VFELQLLRSDHADGLLGFERENREYFARFISDRGDTYFECFGERLRDLLAEQEAGVCRFHVLVSEGEILGRFNLVDIEDGSADLGYRVAERAAGRGLATAAVRELCAMAAESYGLTALRAAAALDNPASRAVLTRTGFAVTGETVLNGQPSLTYHRLLGAAAGNSPAPAVDPGAPPSTPG
jgi:[ribosomal protein S5]-alanine N-acetyltransferase